ncbi:hypothetical protein Tco_1466823 [Tanacetum coccineum]
MLTRAMAKELSAASAHECLFVDFLSEKEPKKVFEALKHPGWVNVMQEELNQFSKKKFAFWFQHLMERYLKGTPSLGFWYLKCLGFDLKGYLDSDYVRCNMDRKSTSAMSSAEAEYVAVAACCARILWMKSQLTNYDIIYEKVPIFCDNTSAIAISNNLVLHLTTKRIDIKYYFIKDHILKWDIELHFVPTQYQLVDIFTKPLNEPTFKRLICELVLKETNRVWFSTPTRGIIGEVGLTSFRNAIGANYLAHSRQYVEPPSMKIIGEWFSSIGYSEEIKAKAEKENSGKDCSISKIHIILLEYKMEGYEDDKEPVAFEAPNTSVYNRKKVPKGKKSGAKTGHRNKSTSLLIKNNPMSKIEATKGGSSSKETTGSPTGHSKKRESSLAKDQNPSQPPASTPVVARLHKEAQQATHGPTSLGVTSEEGANAQLNSGISASIYTKPIYSASTITHSKSTSEHDILASSKAGADYGLSAPKDSVSQTTSNDKGPNKLSLDHILTGKGASNIAKEIEDEFNTSLDLSSSDDTQKDIKLEDLSKLIQNVEVNFMDLDSPKDDQPIIIEDEEEEDDAAKDDAKKVQPKQSKETKDTSAPHPPSLNSLPTKLKELPSKFNELTREVKELKKHVHDLEIEIPRDLEEIPNKLETFTSTVKIESVQAKIKTLDALPSLLNKVTEALNKFAKVIESASKKAGDHVVSKESYKDAEKANLNKPIPTTTPATSTIPPIITTTTTQLESPFLLSPPKSSSQPKGELIKKYKGKEAMSSKDVKRVLEVVSIFILLKIRSKNRRGLRNLLKLMQPNKKWKQEKKSGLIFLVLTWKGPITLKVYKEDGTDKVIPNFKASDLHLDE